MSEELLYKATILFFFLWSDNVKSDKIKLMIDDKIEIYSIVYDDKYDEFMEDIKNIYKTKISSRKENEIIMKNIDELDTVKKNNKVIYDGISYPYIYKLLYDGFCIDDLQEINKWLENDNIDISITNKNEIIERYFDLLQFNLLYSINKKELEKLLSIFDTKYLKIVKKQLEDIKEDTNKLLSSSYKDKIIKPQGFIKKKILQFNGD